MIVSTFITQMYFDYSDTISCDVNQLQQNKNGGKRHNIFKNTS